MTTNATKAQLQICNANYTRGFMDGTPRENYHPRPEASGSYQEVYHEGYQDASRPRKELGKDTKFAHMKEEELPVEFFDLVRELRACTASIDVRFAKAPDIYRSQCEHAERVIEDLGQRAIVEATAKRVAEIMQKAAADKEAAAAKDAADAAAAAGAPTKE